MKEKKRGLAVWVLLFLSIAPFLIALLSVQFLPDQIPAHYNISGEIDRWGSKYEMFILAAAFSLAGWILWLVARFSGVFANNDAERARAQANGRTVVKIGIAVQLLMCALQIAFTWAAFQEISVDATAFVLPIWKIVSIGTGVLFIIVGNLMPKTQPNNLIGVRTAASMRSAEAWAKSQRVGGIAFVVAGSVCVVLSLFLQGPVLLGLILGTTLLAAVVSVVYPLRIK